MLAEMIDEKETETLSEEIIKSTPELFAEEVKMYRLGYVAQNGQYIKKQFEHCPVCSLELSVFKCENKLYESYQIVTHIKKCQTLKETSKSINQDNKVKKSANIEESSRFDNAGDTSSSSYSHLDTDLAQQKDAKTNGELFSPLEPMTCVYIKEEPCTEADY